MQPQQIRMPPQIQKQKKRLVVARPINFTHAYKLCLFERKGKKPSVKDLKEFMEKNGVALEPREFLNTMYKKGLKNESY